MRIAQDRLQGIARAIIDDLVRADAIVLGTSHEAATTAVLGELETYFKAEATLERDAERLADQHLKAAGRDGVGLDRKRVVQMIKSKLAQERGFPA